MSARARYSAKVIAVTAAVLLVPAAALDGFFFSLWLNEGVNGTTDGRGSFTFAFLPLTLLCSPFVLTIAVLVLFFTGDVPGSAPAADSHRDGHPRDHQVGP